MGNQVTSSIANELQRARERRVPYVELGGWAISEERRCTGDVLRLALSAFSLAFCLGSSLGITMATVKHSSSSILRRMGGSPLECDGEELPAYYDPAYRCDMEILRFDSQGLDLKYRSWINDISARMADVPLFCRQTGSAVLPWLPFAAAERQRAVA